MLKRVSILKFVDKKLANERYEICMQCEQLNKTFKKCNACGCFILGKTKIETTCPLGKW